MRRNLKHLSLILLIWVSFSCERDDICLEPNTPFLIISFYDADNPTEKKSVSNLVVNIEGVGEINMEGIPTITDSIAIPVRVDQDLSKYTLSLPTDPDDQTIVNPDQFDLTYTRLDEFISRSCGYKTLFYDIQPNLIVDQDPWIKQIETVDQPQDIIDETKKHIKIYH